MVKPDPRVILKEHNIPITIQRVKILEYLIRTNEHPTADQIYSEISDEAILSFATIYNTLHLFTKAGIVNELHIDKDKTHYDIVRKPHDHFLCRECQKIYDIYDLPIQPLTNDTIDGHSIERVHIYFYGICRECLKKNKR